MAKHKNYETLNLLGYGLAKYDLDFINQMGYTSKQAFYTYLVSLKVAENENIIKNRQDLFDPFFDNGRKGWWQKGDAYIHRKTLIDAFFGQMSVKEYADMIKFRLSLDFQADSLSKSSPILDTKFRKMQQTGSEAEEYFICNYEIISLFSGGSLEDARLYGDGYDFQISVANQFYLAEVKGVRTKQGAIRITENEYLKAKEYKLDYVLTVVSNLDESPKFTVIQDPIKELQFEKKHISTKEQYSYNTATLKWQ